MITSAFVESLAEEFWKATRLGPEFPRSIESAVSRALPVTIVKLPRVTVGRIKRYLIRRQLPSPPAHADTDMLGCLFADHGNGFIFVRGDEDPFELRFTIAHEAAHFILDYQLPRQSIIRELGRAICQVLDGDREPTSAERKLAVLRQIRVGPHVHILPRVSNSDGSVNDGDRFDENYVHPAEDHADALALEILAPRCAILAAIQDLNHLDSAPTPAPGPIEHLPQFLSARFHLPPHIFVPFIQKHHPALPDSFLNFAIKTLHRGGIDAR